MTEDQIDHMVNRFLQWKLPEHFRPDGGVSFQPSFPEEPMRSRHWPSGTNILCATQARQMILHMLEGLPDEPVDDVDFEMVPFASMQNTA